MGRLVLLFCMLLVFVSLMPASDTAVSSMLKEVDPSAGINPGYHRRQLQHVIIYEHAQFRGEKATYKGFGCINLLKQHQDLASSIFFRGECMHLYDGESCTGQFVTLYDTVSSLVPMEFNDKVSSISAC